MIKIEDKIISLDVFETYFLCDLQSCKGSCCVEGDSGAPLLEDEKLMIQKNYKKIKPYMSSDGRKEVENNGFSKYDFDGELTTSLVKNRECVFVYDENNISKCAIEKSYNENKIKFKKPISCHLFPIRINEYDDFDAVNYEKIKICKPACECGSKLKIPLYVFLKEALIRKYGTKWYRKLLKIADKLKCNKEKKG